MTDFQDELLVTKQDPTGWLPYPAGIFRGLVRLPVWMYRLGLGQLANRMHLMVMTTWGRKTGLPRHTAIEYRAHGSKIYVVSIWGPHTNWYHNLTRHPVARLRLGKRVINAQAEVVTDSSEALRVLYLFRKRAPFIYDPILAKLSNRESVDLRTLPDISDQITIVRLDPSTEVVGPPPVEGDLRWLWLVPGAVLAIMSAIMIGRRRFS